MVASQQHDAFGIVLFNAEKKETDFNSKNTSVNIVTEEQIISFRREAAILEKSEKIWELAMDITYIAFIRYRHVHSTRNEVTQAQLSAQPLT